MELSTKPILPGSFVVVKDIILSTEDIKGLYKELQKKELRFFLKEVIGINS